MCGICGFTGEIISRDETLKNMTDVITHRGPDSEGFFSNENISMGFRRLSIIDLDQGNQPIYNEDRTLVLTFNGEIYNYKTLKEELQSLGHAFCTDTDSEVLVHGFEQWGENLLDKLRGMFAFAIYNTKNNSLFLARDFFGIKPLHYALVNEHFVYGSEIKSILKFPNLEKKFNFKALDNYLSFQYCPPPETFFEGIYCLLPGHFLWFKNGKIETKCYFKPEFNPDEKLSFDEAKIKIENVFADSVAAHKISDVEVGCFLSSGVDSSYVSTFFPGQKAFTVGFDFGSRYNEIDFAKKIAKHVGLDHHYKIISSEEFWSNISKVQYMMDQPLADPSCIALFFVAKLASEHVKVVLSGEGSDEFFGGYTIYYESPAFKLYQKILPKSLRRGLAKIASSLPFHFKGQSFMQRASKSLEERFIGNAYMFSQKDKINLLKEPHLATNPAEFCKKYYNEAQDYDNVTKMQYLDINLWMVGDILLKADRMSMANSLELRVPFLDKEVFKVASSLPTHLKVNKLNTKYALRMAALEHLPEATAQKRKLGFPVPTRVWLRDEMYYNIVKELFLSETASKFFNTNVLVKYLDRHFNGKEDNSRKIWTIYIFLVWYNIYFEN